VLELRVLFVSGFLGFGIGVRAVDVVGGLCPLFLNSFFLLRAAVLLGELLAELPLLDDILAEIVGVVPVPAIAFAFKVQIDALSVWVVLVLLNLRTRELGADLPGALCALFGLVRDGPTIGARSLPKGFG